MHNTGCEALATVIAFLGRSHPFASLRTSSSCGCRLRAAVLQADSAARFMPSASRVM